MKYWGALPVALVAASLVVRALLVTPPLEQLAVVASEPQDPPHTIAHAGDVLVARGGPVIVGFQADTPARLVVGDKELVGRGLIKDRVVLAAGPTPIRFAGDASARLVWSPVGRRGDPEYVPASSLSRSGESFPPWAGAAPLDGLVALALLVVLMATLCMLARDRLRGVERRMWIALGVVFVGACIVRWIGIASFGQAWDEDVNWSAGRNYVTNLLALDFHARSWIWNYEHPPIMKYLDGIGAQFADSYGPARILSAIWTSLGCALLVPIGTRLYSFRVGVLAAIIAALLPPLVAHGQIVGHESPTVLWWALGILLALQVHDDKPTPRQLRIRLAWLGVVIGVAVASRFVNGLLGVLCLGIVIEQAPERSRTARDAIWILPLVALVTLYAVWPRIWLHPIAQLGASLDKLERPHTIEPFLGAFTNQPGPHYFFAYLAATLPIAILAGVVMWFVRGVRERSSILMVGWLLIPLAVVASPVRQDGVRYVMPSVLALAMMAAAGWDWLAGVLRWRRAFTAITAALVGYLGITLARIHPYYLDYFGEQVGGPGTVEAHHWFETAWWGEGVDRAVAYVNKYAAPGAKVFRNCIEPSHLAWFRQDLWTPMVNDPSQADWIVTYAPHTHRCPIPDGAKRVLTVEAQGAVLAEVWAQPTR